MRLVADANIEGQLNAMVRTCLSTRWRSIWADLEITVSTFEELGLTSRSPDNVVWHTIQTAQANLVTANRNYDGPDSLEATIRQFNTPLSLPVFTLADADRVLLDSEYREQTLIRLLDYLMDIDNYRGTGRLYIP